jgi:hypothetical protein
LATLLAALNALELDLGVPSLSTIQVEAGKYSAADFQGVAWAAFRNLERSGRACLTIRSDRPASALGFMPSWPVFSYSFDFTGTLAKDGYIDLSLYIGGISVAGDPYTLRLLEWDGKSYTDITKNVDPVRGIITGRTNKLSTYVIMSPIQGSRQITY